MPMMPSRLPQMRWPSIQVGDQPVHLRSSVSTVAPSASRRGTARISAMVMSAVSSVRTPGVLVTVMPRSTAAATSILSTPLPKFAISLSRSPALPSTASSMRSVTVGTSTSAVFTASTSSAWRHRLVVGIEPRVEQLAHADFDRCPAACASPPRAACFGSRHRRCLRRVWQSGIAARLSAARSGLFNRCSSTLHPSFSGACGLRPRPICNGWPRHDKQRARDTMCRCVTSRFVGWFRAACAVRGS